MASSLSDPCVQVALPAALSGRLARHQRLRLRDPEPYGRTVTAIPWQGVYHLPARLLGRACAHAVARDQGRQAASAGRRSLIVGGWLGCRVPQTSVAPAPIIRSGRLRFLTCSAPSYPSQCFSPVYALLLPC